ncbi:MAG: hypothetical protein R3A46_09645 [Thermomicrobiales bacterium]
MAAGRNLMKVILGSAVGTGVAALVARKAQQDDLPEEERVPLTETVKTAPIRLRERWERAKEAGAEAEAEATAHLTAAFRDKVNDPDALTPPRPPSR